MLSDLVPVPLVDFLATRAEKLGQLRDLGLRPLRVYSVLVVQPDELFAVEARQLALLSHFPGRLFHGSSHRLAAVVLGLLVLTVPLEAQRLFLGIEIRVAVILLVSSGSTRRRIHDCDL